MISYTQGDILQAKTEAVVNPVNCVGVMGAGLAKQFKEAYPEAYEDYKTYCAEGHMKVYKCHMFVRKNADAQKYIINCPTKDHWREPSYLHNIDMALDNLVFLIRKQEIKSISIPALGTGLGGLAWDDVKKMMEQKFFRLPQVEIIIYEPQGNTP